MKKLTLISLLSAIAILVSPAATLHWNGPTNDSLYSNPLNWGGTLPTQGDNAYFSSATPVTVTFPAGGYTDMATTETAANSDVTFDTTGTWWLKPANSTWGNPTFRVGGGAHGFNIEGENNAKAQMLLSNGVLRAHSTSTAMTTTLHSGFLDFYQPDGITTENTIVIGHDDNRNHYVVFEPGSTSRFDRIRFRAKGSENIIRINGGMHEVFGEFRIADQNKPGTTGLIEIAGGELVTHYFNHLGANAGQIGQVSIEGTGMWRAMQSIEIGHPGYGILDINGGTLYMDPALRNHDLIMGHTTHGTGVVNITSGTINHPNYQTLIGNNGVGFFNISGGEVNTKYFHTGHTVSATGTVTMTGGTWINTGNGSVGNNGNGTFTISGGTFTVDNDWFGVGKNASAIGRMTLAGGNTSFHNILPGMDGGDGILHITGGTNRFNNFTMGFKPNLRSLAWISGGFNEMWGGSGIIAGLIAKGDVLVDGGTTTTTQIRLGQSGSQDDLVSTMTISGGVVRVQNNINVADNLNNSGILRLHGGLLETPNIRGWTGAAAKGGNGTATFEADGGTLRNNNVHNSPDFFKDFDSALLGPKGLTLLAEPNNITVAQSFGNLPGISGTLIKTGSGTLTLTGANTHTHTIVANGTLYLDGSGTLGSNLTVTNSAAFSLAGPTSSITLDSLTLGCASTSGWLIMDPNDTITITQPNALSIPNGWIRLTNPTQDGTHTLFNCAGNLSLASITTLDIANPALGKAYTFNATYNSGSDSTAVTLTIQNSSSLSITEYTWSAATDTSWDNPLNWLSGSTPLADVAALFTDAATSKTVALTPGATAGALRFNASTSYTLSGNNPLELNNVGRHGEISATDGTHTIAAPLSLNRTAAIGITGDSALTLSGTINGSGGLYKMGNGKLTLTGANTFSGRITADGGELDIANANAFGTANPDHSNLILSSGTLRYSGNPTEKNRGFTITAPDSTDAVIFDIASDLTLNGRFWNNSGALIKRGAATLELRPTSNSRLTSDSGKGIGSTDLPFPSDGSSPSTGYTGLTVAEGHLRILSTPEHTIQLKDIINIGGKTTVGTAQPILELNGGTYDVGDGNKHTYIGYGAHATTTLTNPVLHITGNARVNINTINIGHELDLKIMPELLIEDGSIVETYWGNNLANSGTAITTIRNGALLANLNNETRLISKFTATIDNAALEARNTTRSGRLLFGGNANGTLLVKNGGRLSFPEITMESNHNDGVHLIFDNGILQPTASSMLIFRNDAKHTVQLVAGGITFDLCDDITYTVARPLTGTGGITKTGAGRLIFSPTLEDAVDHTNATSLVAGAYTGTTRIAEGTLELAAGTLRTDAAIELNEDATLDLSSDTITVATLSGAGSVINGELTATTLSPETTESPIATLTLDSLNFTGTTFECDVEQAPDSETVVASDLLNITGTLTGAGFVDFKRTPENPLATPTTFIIGHYNPSNPTPDLSGWKVRNTGRNGVTGQFTTQNGEIHVTLHYSAGTLLKIR